MSNHSTHLTLEYFIYKGILSLPLRLYTDYFRRDELRLSLRLQSFIRTNPPANPSENNVMPETFRAIE